MMNKEEKIVNGYYQSNIKTSRNEYSVYAMKYASQQMLIDDLQQRINDAIEYNKQIIKDTKSFYRPTSDTIYSGDCLIDIAEQNIKMLEGKE